MIKTLRIEYPNGRTVLNLPKALDEMPLYGLKKIFELLFQNYYHTTESGWVNIQQVDNMELFFPEWIADHKLRWGEASKAFQDKYKDPEYGIMDKRQQAKIRTMNKALENDVRKQKRAYEKSEKVYALWTEEKTKRI